MASPYRKRAIRNFSSAGNSVVKFTGRAVSKTAVGLFKWATTDHTGLGEAFSHHPQTATSSQGLASNHAVRGNA